VGGGDHGRSTGNPRVVIVDGCPKRMVFGPCGGVRPGGACELDAALPCPWAAPTGPAGPMPVRRWDGPTPDRAAAAPGSLLAVARERPVVLTDLSVPPYDVATLRDVARRLAEHSDALLVGEHHDVPDFPPTMMAAELHAAGARPWITLTCRDRNRVVLEQELAGLAALGVEGVLCVTGDGRGPGVRPEVARVFDLDSTRLTNLAAHAGLAATVAVAPAAPPSGARAQVLAEKQRAGASLVVTNHAPRPDVLAAFLERARAAGVDLPVIAGVAIYTDEATARGLAALPGLELDEEAVAAVLTAPDPVEAGIATAVAEARALLAVPGVVGVNLSGVGSRAGWVPAAEIKAEVGRRLAAQRVTAPS
jgi:methylenetetrahydrofolate reductase (NADPH)